MDLDVPGDDGIHRSVGDEVLDLEVLGRLGVDGEIHAPVGPNTGVERRVGESAQDPRLNLFNNVRRASAQRATRVFQQGPTCLAIVCTKSRARRTASLAVSAPITSGS